MIPPKTIDYVQDTVGENLIVEYKNERLFITADDVVEARLDQQQLTLIQEIGFQFEAIQFTGSVTEMVFVPNGRLQ